MNIILLSGGSGKRLWPLSNETRSKQFLKLIKNEAGQLESMVQRVFRQIKLVQPEANIVIATGKTQVDAIRNQLGNAVDIVIEPERRDTFPAIALASAYLVLEKKYSADDAVIVLPVDPFADNSYFDVLPKLESLVKSDQAKIALMGIQPTYPSAKYGYIIPAGKATFQNYDFSPVARFQEKPTEEMAIDLIEQGAVWNGGVFAYKLSYLMDLIGQRLKFESFADILLQYSALPKISFDYAVVEREPSIAMVEYCGTWKDLGTWNTLTEVMSDNSVGYVIRSESCENSHVINELDIPVTILGTKNLVVAASPDGILVSDKQESSYLKPLVDQIEQRPMYEERRWGEYKVLDYSRFGDQIHSLTKHMIMKAGSRLSYQKHQLRDEVWTIIDGEGELVLDGQIQQVFRGDVIKIPRQVKHALMAKSDLHFIEVQIGNELVESDIERFDLN